jgi:hypothetical protein
MIKRALPTLAVLFWIATGALGMALLRPAQAAPVPARSSYLPAVAGGTVNAATAQIYTCQCGSATAWVDGDGTVMVTFLSHDQGGKTIVGVDTGTTFTILPDALAFFPGEPIPGPAFDAPGLKDAPGMAVKAFGKRVLYMPIRTEEAGPYNLWRVVW